MATFTRHAVLDWSGDVMHGAGTISAGTGAFAVGASFPRVAGDPAGVTTPEEMLAAAHAIYYGVGLRSVIAQRGGTARRVKVTATITADKGDSPSAHAPSELSSQSLRRVVAPRRSGGATARRPGRR